LEITAVGGVNFQYIFCAPQEALYFTYAQG